MQRAILVMLLAAAGLLPNLAAQTPAPPPPGRSLTELIPLVAPLPGKGLSQHPFLYCGEWQDRSTSNQVIYIVRGGKIVWSYTNPLKGELGDCTVLSNGNILFSRQFGASEITPDKEIVWNIDGAPGTEIHTAYPIDQNRVLIMQNGNPAKLLVIKKADNVIEKEMTLPTRVPTGTHGQFRHIRVTPAGSFLVADMDLGKVVEYAQDGKDLWSYPPHRHGPQSA